MSLLLTRAVGPKPISACFAQQARRGPGASSRGIAKVVCSTTDWEPVFQEPGRRAQPRPSGAGGVTYQADRTAAQVVGFSFSDGNVRLAQPVSVVLGAAQVGRP